MPNEYRGRALGAFAMTAAVAEVAGMATAGALGGRIGIIAVLATQGAVYVAAGLLVLAIGPSLDESTAGPPASPSGGE